MIKIPEKEKDLIYKLTDIVIDTGLAVSGHPELIPVRQAASAIWDEITKKKDDK